MATLGRSLFWKSEINQDWNLLLLPLAKSKAGSLSYASFFQLPNTPELNHSLGTDSEGTVSPTESPLLPCPQAPMLTMLGSCGHQRLWAAMPRCGRLHRACAERVAFCTEEQGRSCGSEMWKCRDWEKQGCWWDVCFGAPAGAMAPRPSQKEIWNYWNCFTTSCTAALFLHVWGTPVGRGK